MSRRTLYLLLLALSLLAGELSAQTTLDPMTAGQTYIVAFPDTTTNKFDVRFPFRQVHDTLALFIYTPNTTTALITGNGYSNNVTLIGGGFTEVYLDDAANNAPEPIVTESNTITPNVFRVEAEAPVILYAYCATRFGSEAWTPLPVEALGTTYIASTLQGEVLKELTSVGELFYSLAPRAASAEITVIGAYDNTNVTITPADSTVVFDGTPSLTFTINANRTYQVQSFVDTLTAHLGNPQVDLTSVRITADKPIAVMSGNTRSAINASTLPGITLNSGKNMAVECLAPVEQHGTEFVFTPTMDDRSVSGQPGEEVSEKRQGEVVRINTAYSGGELTVESYGRTPTTIDSTMISVDGWHDDVLTGTSVDRARFYHTGQPSQMFAHPYAAVKNISATGGAGSYDMWGSYMVEITPREQWTTFAPFIAPIHPAAMNHYVNIVTDSINRFHIYDENGSVVTGWKTIPGTSVCWTTRAINPGVTHFLRGDDSTVRFGAFLYGFYKGHEEHRPGGTKRKDDGRGVAHPSEYEEYLGLAYGYPIAPRRAALAGGDSLNIEVTKYGDSAAIDVISYGSNPAGLRDVRLGAGSYNTRIANVVPAVQQGASQPYASFNVVVLDRNLDARAVVLLRDRTGAESSITLDFPALQSGVEWSSLVNGSVSLSPTPARNHTELKLSVRRAGTMELTLLDAQGSEVLRLVRTVDAGEATLPLDLKGLQSGAYYCRVSINGATKTLPLVIAR